MAKAIVNMTMLTKAFAGRGNRASVGQPWTVLLLIINLLIN